MVVLIDSTWLNASFSAENTVYQNLGADQYPPDFFYLTIKKMGQQIKKRIKFGKPVLYGVLMNRDF